LHLCVKFQDTEYAVYEAAAAADDAADDTDGVAGDAGPKCAGATDAGGVLDDKPRGAGDDEFDEVVPPPGAGDDEFDEVVASLTEVGRKRRRRRRLASGGRGGVRRPVSMGR
jgi:hypothetical protein